jgi:hypothetical protein
LLSIATVCTSCDVLDSRALERDSGSQQAFRAGVSRPREIDHDANLYATFCQEEARLRDDHPDLEIRGLKKGW